jgi:hypothetical protein
MNFPIFPQIPDMNMFPINPFAPPPPRRSASPRRSARSSRRPSRRSSPRRSHRHSHHHSRRTPQVIVVDPRSSAQRRSEEANRRLEEERIRSQYAATQAGLFYQFLKWLFGGKRN